MLARVAALPQARETNMTPDGARFLNIARCITRGQGFSTPEAWPAWMNPPRLPMPETFKEPGYPYAIAALEPVARDPFRAGQWLSFLSGLLIPFVVFALGRRIHPDGAVAGFAGLLAAASPLLIVQSVYVMAESVFALVLLLAFLAAAPRPDPAGGSSRLGAGRAGFAAGVLFGLAFLVRAQALEGLPALVVLLLAVRPWRTGLLRLGLAVAGACLALAPYAARNLRLFGAPLHSDVAAFGLWPYVDQFALVHSLERPQPAAGFALSHLPQVGSYALHSLVRFLRFTLPHDLLGHWAWLAPLAIGAVVGLRRSAWAFVYLYLVVNAAFMLSLYWAARYFTTAAPLLCLLTASGGVWMRRTHGERRLVGALRLRHVLLPCALLVALFQIVRTDRTAAPTYTPELEAARSQAAFLRARLAPGEAVMAEITSYWAYFTDRPAVYPVVADEARFREVVRRLRVRYAALPTSRLAEFAARYPARRLPAALVRHHEDAAHDVTVFEVRADD